MPQPSSQQTHVDAMLTNISVAYMQSEDAFIADKVFPKVPVQKQSARYFKYLKEDWFRDEAELRAPATESAGGGYEIDNTPNYYCNVYAYHKNLDDQTRNNTDSPLDADRSATEFVSSKLLLRRELAFMNTYFKTGIWGTEVAGVAATPTAGQTLQWDQTGADPIGDVADACIAMVAATGKRPNVLTLGPQVYNALKQSPAILERIKYTQRGIITTDILAAMFDVPKVVVAWGIQNTAAKGKTATMGFIYGKHALLSYAAPSPGLQEASAGYIFTWTGYAGAGAYGNAVYNIPTPLLGRNSIRIEGEMAFDMKVVASDLGYFFNGIVA
jgi:hypothetical protein